MARALSLPIKLLHAVDFARLGLDTSIFPDEVEVIQRHFKQKLEEYPFAALAPDLPPVERELADGPAVESIVRCAERMQAPLIMMPTRGHTRFRQMLLGSVTAGVLHDATAPVWTEAHSPDDTPPRGVVTRSVVCAVDVGPQTPAVLRMAAALSTHFAVPLHVVHSIPEVDPHFRSGPASRAHRLLIAQARDRFPSECATAGFQAPLEIVSDTGVVSGILRSVDKYGADLLVIGRGCIHGPLGRLRTIAHELIRLSPCPVVSV